MNKQNNEKIPIMATLRALDVGGLAAFELGRFNSVKNSCTNAWLQYGLKYSTHINRETSTIEVTRLE